MVVAIAGAALFTLTGLYALPVWDLPGVYIPAIVVLYGFGAGWCVHTWRWSRASSRMFSQFLAEMDAAGGDLDRMDPHRRAYWLDRLGTGGRCACSGWGRVGDGAGRAGTVG